MKERRKQDKTPGAPTPTQSQKLTLAEAGVHLHLSLVQAHLQKLVSATTKGRELQKHETGGSVPCPEGQPSLLPEAKLAAVQRGKHGAAGPVKGQGHRWVEQNGMTVLRNKMVVLQCSMTAVPYSTMVFFIFIFI